MSNNFRITLTTPTWSTSVAPVVGGAFGHVCPDAVAFDALAMRPRDIAGFAARKQGFQSWSPPSP